MGESVSLASSPTPEASRVSASVTGEGQQRDGITPPGPCVRQLSGHAGCCFLPADVPTPGQGSTYKRVVLSRGRSLAPGTLPSFPFLWCQPLSRATPAGSGGCNRKRPPTSGSLRSVAARLPAQSGAPSRNQLPHFLSWGKANLQGNYDTGRVRGTEPPTMGASTASLSQMREALETGVCNHLNAKGHCFRLQNSDFNNLKTASLLLLALPPRHFR